MIAGVGIDMIEVERVNEKISKNMGFRELVFSPHEIAYCETKTNKFEHYAARFAAKEAFLKAAGTGWMNEFNLFEIEVVNDGNGKPSIQLSGQTGQAFESKGPLRISVSLSHLKSIASAIVILETDHPI